MGHLYIYYIFLYLFRTTSEILLLVVILDVTAWCGYYLN